MKMSLFFLVVSLSPLFLTAQPSIAPIPPDLTAAFGKGDVSTISGYFADKVELKLTDESETLMKAEATTRLREFFAAHPAESFTVMPLPESKEKKQNYEAGVLITNEGKYKVHIFFAEPESNKRLITALKFKQ